VVGPFPCQQEKKTTFEVAAQAGVQRRKKAAHSAGREQEGRPWRPSEGRGRGEETEVRDFPSLSARNQSKGFESSHELRLHHQGEACVSSAGRKKGGKRRGGALWSNSRERL